MPYSTLTPEIWSPTVTSFFKAKLLAARAFTDLSGDVTEGGDRINLPHMPDGYTTSAITQSTGNLTWVAVTKAETVLSIDQWRGMSIPLSDFRLAQIATKYNIRRLLAQDAGFTLARTFDRVILTEAQDNAGAVVGASDTDLDATALEEALSIIESNSVPKDQLRLIVHPKPYFVDLFKSSKVYDASTFGIPNLPSGNIDVVYGVPVFRTPQVLTSAGGYNNLLVHPLGLAWATGNIPGMSGGAVRVEFKQASPSSVVGAKRTDIELDLMYGVQSWRTEGIVCIRSTGG